MKKLFNISKLRMNSIFEKSISSLKETSLDSVNNVYMSNKDTKVVNFDLVKRYYLNKISLSEEYAHSVDALSMTKSENVLIEFKNGDIYQKDIRSKAMESILIYDAIANKTIDDTRKNMILILVYNEENYRKKNIDYISEHFLQKGNTKYFRFGLDKYYKLAFKDAFEYTREEFNNFSERLIDIV